jgi:hypothetical protein
MELYDIAGDITKTGVKRASKNQFAFTSNAPRFSMRRTVVSSSGAVRSAIGRPARLPPRLPPEVNGKFRPSQDLKIIKKPAFYAGLVEVLGCFRMLSDDPNGGAGD